MCKFTLKRSIQNERSQSYYAWLMVRVSAGLSITVPVEVSPGFKSVISFAQSSFFAMWGFLKTWATTRNIFTRSVLNKLNKHSTKYIKFQLELMTRKLKTTTQSKMQHKQELLSNFEVREIIKIGSESNQLFSLRSASRGSSVLFRFILRTTDPSSAAILTACLAEHDGMGSYT